MWSKLKTDAVEAIEAHRETSGTSIVRTYRKLQNAPLNSTKMVGRNSNDRKKRRVKEANSIEGCPKQVGKITRKVSK